jgi:hypothetical protein
MGYTEDSRPGKPDVSCKVQIAVESEFNKPLVTEDVKPGSWGLKNPGGCLLVDKSYGDPLIYDSGEDFQWSGFLVYENVDKVEFNGTLTALEINGRKTARYVVRRGDDVYLFPINSGYKTIVISLKEYREDVKVFGIVKHIISRFPQQFMDKGDPFEEPKRSSIKPSVRKRGRPRKSIEMLWKEISKGKKWKDAPPHLPG